MGTCVDDAGRGAGRVLVVDDEKALAGMVASYLVRAGYDVAQAHTGPAALEAARAGAPDVVVLDLGLPGLDGIEVCRRIRTFSECYVLMLTARGDEGDRLIRLVEDIDDVSRAEEGRMVLDRSPVPVAQLLRSAADAAGEAYAAKGVGLRVDDGTGAAVLPVDRQRMGQVLGNLLSNALRHTPPGGDVVLGAAPHASGGVVLRVADTGEGMAAEQLPHVFERFYRGDTARDREHGGSGIGLTISRALVEAHGGTLDAASAGPGRGAEFRVVLPRRHTAPPAAP